MITSMKTTIYITLIGTLAIFLSSCIQLGDTDNMVISFYTDIEHTEGMQPVVLVNGEEVGALLMSKQDPSCGDSLLISIDIEDQSDLHIDVMVGDQNHYLGFVNLYSPSHGIKIKPAEPDAFFVRHALDESCTRIRLKW